MDQITRILMDNSVAIATIRSLLLQKGIVTEQEWIAELINKSDEMERIIRENSQRSEK